MGCLPVCKRQLSGFRNPGCSVFGSEDGLATGKKIEASKQLLPPDTIWVKIEGGNHAQFGWYGDQAGDNVATVSREEQQEQTISATIKMLEQIK